jgi:hypothetical protein
VSLATKKQKKDGLNTTFFCKKHDDGQAHSDFLTQLVELDLAGGCHGAFIWSAPEPYNIHINVKNKCLTHEL